MLYIIFLTLIVILILLFIVSRIINKALKNNINLINNEIINIIDIDYHNLKESNNFSKLKDDILLRIKDNESIDGEILDFFITCEEDKLFIDYKVKLFCEETIITFQVY